MSDTGNLSLSPTDQSDPQSDPAQSAQSNVTELGDQTPGASQSIEPVIKRGRGVHNPNCACTICQRKKAKAEKKSGSPTQPPKPSGASSESSSGKNAHLPSKSKPSTSLTMAKKIAAMTNEQRAAQPKAKSQSDPQSDAEASLAHSPKQGGWWDRFCSGWSTVID